MLWIAFLVTVFITLGLRDRAKADSTHLTIVVVTVLVLAAVFVLPQNLP
jgi:hypothetical protein